MTHVVAGAGKTRACSYASQRAFLSFSKIWPVASWKSHGWLGELSGNQLWHWKSLPSYRWCSPLQGQNRISHCHVGLSEGNLRSTASFPNAMVLHLSWGTCAQRCRCYRSQTTSHPEKCSETSERIQNVGTSHTTHQHPQLADDSEIAPLISCHIHRPSPCPAPHGTSHALHPALQWCSPGWYHWDGCRCWDWRRNHRDHTGSAPYAAGCSSSWCPPARPGSDPGMRSSRGDRVALGSGSESQDLQPEMGKWVL